MSQRKKSEENSTRAGAGGFTLVELLIVILIVAALAGMLMLVAGTSTEKAEALRMINTLHSVRTACSRYYSDYGEWPVGPGDSLTTNNTRFIASIEPYMDRPLEFDGDALAFGIEQDGSKVIFGYSNGAGRKLGKDGIRAKLAELAGDEGLKGNRQGAAYTGGASDGLYMYANWAQSEE